MTELKDLIQKVDTSGFSKSPVGWTKDILKKDQPWTVEIVKMTVFECVNCQKSNGQPWRQTIATSHVEDGAILHCRLCHQVMKIVGETEINLTVCDEQTEEWWMHDKES